MGRRSASQRMAHVLCEMQVRLRAVGLADDGSYAWPIRQAELADATGLSMVHINRMLQQLRSDKLIALSGREVRILDWQELQRIGEFTPRYLYLDLPGEAGRAA